MAQEILNDGESKGIFRGKLNNNFSELYGASEINAASVDALQSEATAKWIMLNNVDNRSRSNESRIAALENLVSSLKA